MALVPLSYNLRSLFVRRTATFLTVVSIGATVATVSGVLALQRGFKTLFAANGSDQIAVFLRQGATNEGDSVFTRERAEILIKSLDVAQLDAQGRPLIAAETYLAARLYKMDGGETNVPVRGIQPMTFAVHGERVRVGTGRAPAPGTDEVVVGRKLVERIQSCNIGDFVQFNTTPFLVVGILDHEGAFASEIWGDRERIAEALERPVFSRVIALVKPGTEIGYPDDDSGNVSERLTGLARRYDEDPQVPSKVMSERQYLLSQSTALGLALVVLGVILGSIMGVAAVFTAANTMLAALAARTQEIGILLALGFRWWAIFLSFLFESLVLGLLGGVVGVLLVLPINGLETGTMNWNTFTELAFAFRITPDLLLLAVLFSMLLGLLGGAIPALRAALMSPTQALKRD